jgi:release factor glutamine methyltransferase
MSRVPTTLGAALASARAVGVGRLDAQVLAAHVLRRSRAWVIAHADACLESEDSAAFDALLQRRAAGEPLAYLTGQREFFGLELAVSPQVLVPRPDTETLVEWALDLLHGPLGHREAPRVIDLGTGSGAIALAVKHACPRAELHATDLSAAALDVARRNRARLALDVRCHEGAWWSAVPGLRFDLALSNPPYVAPGDPHLCDLRHEPQMALTPVGDGGSGLADIEHIVSGAGPHLLQGAWLLVEHGKDQSSAVQSCLRRHGFPAPETRQDLAGRARVTGAVYAP